MSHDMSYRAVMRERGFWYLLLMCGGIWLFAGDRLMEATLLPDIVSDIGGAKLIGWGRTLYETAAIMTGMIAAFLTRRWGIWLSFSACAVGFVLGCVISVIANDMVTFQVGRFLQGLAGSAFLSLASVGIVRMFPLHLIARAGSVIAIVWAFAAFSGPLVGGLFSQYSNWRMAFVYLAVLGAILAVTAFLGLQHHEALVRPITDQKAEPFPALRMAILFSGAAAIATAGIFISPIMTPMLIGTGSLLLVAFFVIDAKSGARRLLPIGTMRISRRTGAAGLMVMFLSASSIGIAVFGPVLLVAIYGLAPIVIGFMMFGTAVGWTAAEVIFSGTPMSREGRVIVWGALAVLAGALFINLAFYLDIPFVMVIGFILNGAGFGGAFALVTRRAIANETGAEKDRIAAATATAQRLGLALGAAMLGVLASGLGFSDVMDVATARLVLQVVCGAAVPLALLGLWAAMCFVEPQHDYVYEAVAVPL